MVAPGGKLQHGEDLVARPAHIHPVRRIAKGPELPFDAEEVVDAQQVGVGELMVEALA